jgi:hypothetical protein
LFAQKIRLQDRLGQFLNIQWHPVGLVDYVFDDLPGQDLAARLLAD